MYISSSVVLFLALAAFAQSAPLSARDDAQPICKPVPTPYLMCASDCLYKACKSDDQSCIDTCNKTCKDSFVPDCNPNDMAKA
ncbi:hypothetical protein GQ53DRAFT_822777 [Thozetella sp. PMI_491]|nr:hypothetical protein GQ53DRAFT_822777 [Thozetella sp. PMI_491]